MASGQLRAKWSCIWQGDSIKVKFGLNEIGTYELLRDPHCGRCSRPEVTTDLCGFHNFLDDALRKIYALSIYYTMYDDRDNLMSQHIRLLKQNRDYAVPIAKGLELIMVKKHRDLLSSNLIIPVPLHSVKKARKGFDHAEEIASQLATLLEKRFANPITKTIDLEMHTINHLPDKIEAVRGLYTCTKAFNKERILLIDDTATTGLDLSECAKVLRQQGASEINALVAGRTIFRR